MLLNIFEKGEIVLGLLQNQFQSEKIVDKMIDTAENVFGIMAILSVIATICFVVIPIFLIAYLIYKHVNSNKKVRLELARQGIVPPMQSASPKPAPDKHRTLRNACLCIGIGLGLIIGIIILSLKEFDDFMKFLIIGSSTMLFLGFSYFGYFFAVKDKKPDDGSKE